VSEIVIKSIVRSILLLPRGLMSQVRFSRHLFKPRSNGTWGIVRCTITSVSGSSYLLISGSGCLHRAQIAIGVNLVPVLEGEILTISDDSTPLLQFLARHKRVLRRIAAYLLDLSRPCSCTIEDFDVIAQLGTGQSSAVFL
jgi:hypothetical protein